MHKKIFLCLISTLLVLAGSAVVADEEDGMKVIPVELYTCNYNEGKGPDDLEKVITMWSAWADKRGMDDYSAWTLTPFYFSPEQEFDMIWMGAAKDAASMGAGQDAWLNSGGEVAAGFNDVLSCNGHANFFSIIHKATPKGATPENSVLTFSDCSFEEGATFEALNEAMGKWAQHLESQGSEAGIFHWYPAYGGGGEEFDFKWLQAHKNLAALGKDADNYGTGGGYKTRRELIGDMIDCDSRRAYLAKNRRYVQLR